MKPQEALKGLLLRTACFLNAFCLAEEIFGPVKVAQCHERLRGAEVSRSHTQCGIAVDAARNLAKLSVRESVIHVMLLLL
jgi:hypothetical protein